MHIKLITNQEELEEALKKVDDLFFAQKGTCEYEQFQVLSELILSYYRDTLPEEFPDPIEALRCHMHWQDRRENELAALLESSVLAENILNRKQPLTLPIIRNLCTTWGIPAESLIQAYELSN